MNLFRKNKIYSFNEIADICDKNNLIIVDCLRNENIISVEEWNNGDLSDCIWEFSQIKPKFLKLKYTDKIYLKSFLKTKLENIQNLGTLNS